MTSSLRSFLSIQFAGWLCLCVLGVAVVSGLVTFYQLPRGTVLLIGILLAELLDAALPIFVDAFEREQEVAG